MQRVIGSIAVLACLVPLARAADAPDAVPPLAYTHVYADSAGISHFRDESFDFRSSRPGGPVSHALGTGPGAMLLRLKPGAVEDWHNAPRAWYLIVVQGMSEVTASDGEKRRFGPGSIVLLDDTTGRGHQTRTVGTIDHVAAVVPIADTPAGAGK
jgi:quercetin dioxygenase-like cupin family protein